MSILRLSKSRLQLRGCRQTLSFCFLCCFASLDADAALHHYSLINENLCALSLQEKTCLTHFFRRLLFDQGFAYSLFGDKPMCLGTIRLGEHWEGLKIWRERAENLFPSKNYLFIYSDEDNSVDILFINKKAFKQVFLKHRTKFVELFGSHVSCEKLLQLLLKRKSLWNTPLKYREDLIGILLGYGQVNAELFQKREEIQGIRADGIKKIRTLPSHGYASIEEELSDIKSRLKSSSNEGVYYCFSLPHFAADIHHPETDHLMKKYRRQRKNIAKKYSSRNFLEITLEQLSS